MNFEQIDHVLIGGNSLDRGCALIQELTGTTPFTGGSHPGKGTRNALLGLSHGAYLEVIGKDPDQKVEKVWMDLDKVSTPYLFRWAAKCHDLEALRNKAQQAGIDIGEIQSGSRKKPDGSLLEWQLTDPDLVLGDGLIPFFIDWGSKGNPSNELPFAGAIRSFQAFHPRPEEIRKILQVLEIDMDIHHSDRVSLELTLEVNGRDVHLS